LVVKRSSEMAATREIDVEATPEEVWEALTTEDGRERWLEEAAEREIHVEVADEPSRLVWWWWSGDEEATRVEFLVVAVPGGTRLVVTETVPRFPVASFASAFAFALA
jgi:uncharacterized protein YndB with AHSA1/START domain